MTKIEKIALVKSIIASNVGNRICTVSINKKDGTLRTMQLHNSKDLESSRTGNNAEATAKRMWTLDKNGMMCVEELVKPGSAEHQYRTLNCATVKTIKCNGKTYDFTNEEIDD